ncbi:unnamed protein product [Spirodela intermedia]|uniref:Uncharacterized protein n=1 Tax=Spirodela intermedia TaxID=51605 RepID=A0A7I8IHL2_SPIIN|nr:unnamed protein product [Spirodela intermedia]CAA6657365.1 unnamed protein product [Spirodela intermedia]
MFSSVMAVGRRIQSSSSARGQRAGLYNLWW